MGILWIILIVVLVLALPGGLARIAFAIRDRVALLVTGLDARPRVEPLDLNLPAAVAETTPQLAGAGR